MEQIGPVGFGSYRIDVNVPSHSEALRYALSQGCNLIDTASTYGDGRSELLVGKVLQETSNRDVFVITKAGYAQGTALKTLRELHARGLATSGFVDHSPDFSYSLHPDFLLCQLEVSRSRLQRNCIDGFLLHNPEHYLAASLTHDDLDTALRPVFEMLEELVDEGMIRYYGISSNHLNKPHSPTNVDLVRLLSVARSVSEKHHFKLIQFPFNLLEQEARMAVNEGPSLLQLAQDAGLRTFSNRPLNATSPNGFIRLASCEERESDDGGSENDHRLFDDCLRLIEDRLDMLAEKISATQIDILPYLEKHCFTFDNSQKLSCSIRRTLLPLRECDLRERHPQGTPNLLSTPVRTRSVLLSEEYGRSGPQGRGTRLW